MSNSDRLIGPFRQVVTLAGLPPAGPLKDEQILVIQEGGLLVREGRIAAAGTFDELKASHAGAAVETPPSGSIAFPGLIDAHTHICWAGSRAEDYALRVGGTSYLEIARRGGGIKSTVRQTRKASREELAALTSRRARRLLQDGVTTCEVKSGYGLTVEEELKMLRAIGDADREVPGDLIPTCLAAHIPPREDGEGPEEYLDRMAVELLPRVRREGLADRVDIFIEDTAFTAEQARPYLDAAARLGFRITVHADQFSTGGALLAAELGALSADHLERTDTASLKALAERGVTALALPGASLGLGEPYAPARRILDAGGALAVASDWNPGSAPMGDLLLQAAVLGAAEKLSMAETWAAVTVRAAAALGLTDRGSLEPGRLADFAVWQAEDWREVLWYQGSLKPAAVWKSGTRI